MAVEPSYVKLISELQIKQGDTLLGPTFIVRHPENIDLNTSPGVTAFAEVRDQTDTLICRWVFTDSSLTFQVGSGTPVSYTRPNFYVQYVDKDGTADSKAAKIALLIEEADSALLSPAAELTVAVKFRFPWASGNTDDLTFYSGKACIIKRGADGA